MRKVVQTNGVNARTDKFYGPKDCPAGIAVGYEMVVLNDSKYYTNFLPANET
jgi:hypothetical protein